MRGAARAPAHSGTTGRGGRGVACFHGDRDAPNAPQRAVPKEAARARPPGGRSSASLFPLPVPAASRLLSEGHGFGNLRPMYPGGAQEGRGARGRGLRNRGRGLRNWGRWRCGRRGRTLDAGGGGTFLKRDLESFGNLPPGLLAVILRLPQGDPWISNGLRNVFRIVSFGSRCYVWSFLVWWSV